jgi:hypothetical protein
VKFKTTSVGNEELLLCLCRRTRRLIADTSANYIPNDVCEKDRFGRSVCCMQCLVIRREQRLGRVSEDKVLRRTLASERWNKRKLVNIP